MSRERPLHGGCSCGRNIYVIEVPLHSTEAAQVIFDKSHAHAQQASPLSAYLRVPLSWYHSTTYAFFDDETHASIRRVYTSPHDDTSKRHFCGYCGTSLSLWSEQPEGEADFIRLSLGSLVGEDLRDLGELGLLPEELLDAGEQEVQATEEKSAVLPWFESLLEGSRLGGHVTRRKGEGQSADGRVRVEWEVVEWTGDDEDDTGGKGDVTPVTGKRKLQDVETVEDNADSVMEGVH